MQKNYCLWIALWLTLITTLSIPFSLADTKNKTKKKQSIIDQPDVNYFIHKQLPEKTESTDFCELCIYKLYPAQAQVGLTCDGILLINKQKIQSKPVTEAASFASAILTAAFSKMKSLKFSQSGSRREGCGYFSRASEETEKNPH